jgi:hypothetical protein
VGPRHSSILREMAFLEVCRYARACVRRVLSVKPLGPCGRRDENLEKRTSIARHEAVLPHLVLCQHKCLGMETHPSPKNSIIFPLRLLFSTPCTTPPFAFSTSTLSLNALRSQAPQNVNHKRKLLSILCVLTYLGHISYLTLLPRFDYAYNMVFNLVLGVLRNILWTLYALPGSIFVLKRYPSRPKSYRPSFATSAGLFVALTTLATSLELFDFPPWGQIIDAHSLWHALKAPIAFYWYMLFG